MRTDPLAAADAAWSPAPPQGIRLWSQLGQIQAPDRLVRRLLGEGTLATIYGAPGSGKSFLAFDLGLSIAYLPTWMGRRVLQGAVLYIAAEGGCGLENRAAAFKARHATPPDVPFAVMARAVDLGPDGTDADAVIEAAKALAAYTRKPVRLIVIDTLNRCINGADENTAEAMGAFVANCSRIIEATGATVLVVHHRGKDAARGMRGHSSLLGAVDTAIEVEKRDSGRVAIVRKSKDTPDGAEIGFDLEVVDLGQDEEGEPITSCVVVASDVDSAPAGPKLSPTEMIFVQELRNALANAGEVRRGDRNLPTVATVARDLWHQRVKSAGATSNATGPNAERALLSKHTKSLKTKGLIGIWDDRVWLTATERNHAQP